MGGSQLFFILTATGCLTDMADHQPNAKDLRAARDRFRDLLSSDGSSESAFQSLFSDCPFILSNALPLHISPVDIIPQGKPGERGSDFLIYPQSIPFVYGAIEIKRPDTPIVTVPRKETIVLSRDSATAFAQAKASAAVLHHRIEGALPLCAIGGSAYLFVVVGLASELQYKANTERLRRQLRELLPANCTLLPYDTLLWLFELSVPPATYLLRPTLQWTPTRSPEWQAAADFCVDYARKNVAPDLPDITHFQSALHSAGYNHDHGFVLSLLSQLVDDGILVESDSTYPPWETLYR